jgi:hypothetical protein
MIYSDPTDAIFIDSSDTLKFEEGPAIFDILLNLNLDGASGKLKNLRDIAVIGYPK